MESKETQVGKMEQQLQQWGVKLDELATKAKQAGADVRADERRLVAELRAKHEAARAKLDEFKATGSTKWETFKDDVESAYHELEMAIKKLKH